MVERRVFHHLIGCDYHIPLLNEVPLELALESVALTAVPRVQSQHPHAWKKAAELGDPVGQHG